MNIKTFLTLLALLSLVIGCQAPESTEVVETAETNVGMIKVTIMYPNEEGTTFDMDYYADKHMPMVARLLGDSLKSYKIDRGVSGRTPEDPTPYLAIGYLYFEKLSAYQNSFGPNAEQIVGDIPNYTNAQPVLQISEVLK